MDFLEPIADSRNCASWAEIEKLERKRENGNPGRNWKMRKCQRNVKSNRKYSWGQPDLGRKQESLGSPIWPIAGVYVAGPAHVYANLAGLSSLRACEVWASEVGGWEIELAQTFTNFQSQLAHLLACAKSHARTHFLYFHARDLGANFWAPKSQSFTCAATLLPRCARMRSYFEYRKEVVVFGTTTSLLFGGSKGAPRILP